MAISRKDKAIGYFTGGYTCAQSVVLAFEDLLPIERENLSKMASSFGGGIGRMREVCGAVSGMAMVMGLLYGFSEDGEGGEKEEHYRRLQQLAASFQEESGSLACRDILGMAEGMDTPIPSERTEAYYEERPCARLVGEMVELMERYIREMDN